MSDSNQPNRLDRIEAMVETTAIAMREMQVKQDRIQQQLGQMQQQLGQRFNELGDFVAAVSNDVAQLAENQQRQDVRMTQLTANVESLVSALQNRFAGNDHGD